MVRLMFAFFSATFLPVRIINKICIASPHLLRFLSLHQNEIRNYVTGSKIPLLVKSTKFYNTVTVQLLQQKNVSEHADPKRMNVKEDVNKVREIFDCTIQEANVIFNKCPAIRHFSVSTAWERISHFKSLGIYKSNILKYPWLLTVQPNELISKLEILKCLKIKDINDFVPLLQASPDCFHAISVVERGDKIPNGNRITYLAEQLRCSISEVCEFIVKFDFVYRIPLQHLKEVVQTLTESGVATQHILLDGWILRYKADNIKRRVEEMRHAGVKVIKPWMLRSSTKNYKSTLRRAKARQTLLGEETVTDYLARRLECSKEHLQFLEKRSPKAFKVKIAKMHEILNILFEEGFTSHQIAIHLRVLENSAETIRARLNKLKSRSIQPRSPLILLKSNKEFENILKKIGGFN